MLEPLLWHWYAWPHLISPATAGANIQERHIQIMKSFINTPDVHIQAQSVPALIGGPFMDLEINDVEGVKDLLKETESQCEELIKLAHVVKSTMKHLSENAKGASLNKYYNELSPLLQGAVELVYDLNNHPRLRLIEEIIYHRFYSSKPQSIMMSEISSDERSFSLSTPRIRNDDKSIQLALHYNHPMVTKLLEAYYKPVSRTDLDMILEHIPCDKQPLFESFFTNSAPSKRDKPVGDAQVRIRYFGHACVLLETKDHAILLDPAISYKYPTDLERYTMDDLPEKIDYVLLTHCHQDHIIFEDLLKCKSKIGCIVVPNNSQGALQDPSLKLILKKVGFNNVRTLDELESIMLTNGRIVGVPFLGEHADLDIQSKLGYFIELCGKKYLFLADSDNVQPAMYSDLHNILGSIDKLFIGMECKGAPLSWLYGPLMPERPSREIDNSRRLSGSDCQKAWGIITAMKCKEVYVYAMGQEPWLNHIMAIKYTDKSPPIVESNKLLEKCADNNIPAQRLFAKAQWVENTGASKILHGVDT